MTQPPRFGYHVWTKAAIIIQMRTHMQKLVIYLSLCTVLVLSACAIHRPTVQQGNVLDSAALAQLKPGLSKRQARFILGNPVLSDPFHADRWDYVYWLKSKGEKPTRQHLTLFFENDTLSRMAPEGVTLPSAAAPQNHQESPE